MPRPTTTAATGATTSRRREQKLERKLRKNLEKPHVTQSIRHAAEQESAQIWSNLHLDDTTGGDVVSLASSVSSGIDSSERAMRRGSRRGIRELNEAEELWRDIDGDDPESEFTTVVTTTSRTDTLGMGTVGMGLLPPPKTKRGFFRKRKSSKRSSKNEAVNSSSNSGDAWMCGVCGQAFATRSAADRHEGKHIERVITDLGLKTKTSSSEHATAEISRPRRIPLRDYDRPQPITRSYSLEEWEKEEGGTGQGARRPRVIPEGEPMTSFGPTSTLPTGTLVPKPRHATQLRFRSSNVDPILGGLGDGEEEGTILISNSLMNSVVLADEALMDVCRRAESDILTPKEKDAERELALLSADKAYYDEMAARAVARKVHPTYRYRSDGEGLVARVQNKLLDAYQIMKEGDEGGARTGLTSTDQYNKKRRRGKEGEGEEEDDDIVHHDGTLYVNVMVRNSVQVVQHELERLAEQRWEKADGTGEHLDRFERFRIYAHHNIVKLAGIALASDFTPRRIAVQLSNDLYSLLTPRLKRRGVTIESEIEYRVGPYFVLAVNITSIDWWRLIKATHRDVAVRKARWEKATKESADEDTEEDEKSRYSKCKNCYKRVRDMSVNDVVEQFFARMFYLHWVIYLPMCYVAYYALLGSSIRQFILSSVTDEVFFYAEKKGMEMEISARIAAKQAAFMLSALREIRAGDRALAKRRKESEQQEKGATIGPLLGPAVKADAEPAVKPDGFEVPANLEFVSLELDLPVGFRRLRWALLSSASDFVTEAIYKTESKYEDITMGEWDKHLEHIGSTSLPNDIDPADFIGATKEGSYMMPRSAFVAANMCFETHYIIAYNDYCFCLKKRSRNPDVPFGKSFLAWTQYLVINLGNDACRLVCSVEAEFPNGEPMVARQIRSGMRAGTGELFVLIGETISKYAAEFP